MGCIRPFVWIESSIDGRGASCPTDLDRRPIDLLVAELGGHGELGGREKRDHEHQSPGSPPPEWFSARIDRPLQSDIRMPSSFDSSDIHTIWR
jgi:hypothetical protein